MAPVLVIAGSVRVERRSFRVAEYVRDRLAALDAPVELIDPRDYPLPPYDGATVTPLTEDFVARCLAAEAFVFAVPEWHAGIPGTLKNMLDYLGGPHFSGKPVGLVSVSSASGGAVVLSHLRDVLGVLGAVLVGPFVPIRNVETAWDVQSGRLADERIDAVLERALRRLLAVREALTEAAVR